MESYNIPEIVKYINELNSTNAGGPGLAPRFLKGWRTFLRDGEEVLRDDFYKR